MCSNSMAGPRDFKVNLTKIKGGCLLGRKVVTYNSKSDLPLSFNILATTYALRLKKNNKYISYKMMIFKVNF